MSSIRLVWALIAITSGFPASLWAAKTIDQVTAEVAAPAGPKGPDGRPTTLPKGPDGKPIVAPSAADLKIAALEARIARLEAAAEKGPDGLPLAERPKPDPRIAEQEARIAKLEAERGVYKAPFLVQGAGGKTILRVLPDGTTLLGAEGGNQIAFFARAGEPANIALQSGNTAAVLAAGAEATLTLTKPGAATTRLAAGGADLGLFVEKNGQLAAGLGAAAGKPVALRLYNKGGKVIAAAGENPRGAGTGFMYVGNGTQNGSALAAEDNGAGLIQVFAADGTVAAGMVGKERLVGAYNASGAPVATLSKAGQSEGGNVTARNPAGEGVFSAGFNNAVGGGDACVYRAKRQNTFCIGIGPLQ